MSRSSAVPVSLPIRSPFTLEAPDGLLLRGERWGEGPRALSFVHGSGLVVESYRGAFAALGARATVHALNARGHGGSALPAAFPDYTAPVADLRRLAERLAAPRVLAGHSYGALLSLRLAAEAPGLAAGLLLLDPLVPWRRGGEWLPVEEGRSGELIAATRARRSEWPSRAAAAEWLRGRGVYRPWTDTAFADFLETGLRERPDGSVTLACPPWMEAAVYGGRPGPELFAWAERVAVPAVILRGADSTHCIAEGAEDLADAFPLAAVLHVSGGHTFPQEHPEAAGRALLMALEFLERNGA